MSRNVRQLLDQARALHHRWGEVCKLVSEGTKEGRIKLLLDYASQHEVLLEKSLQDYEDEYSQKLLDHWIKFTPNVVLDQFFDECELNTETPFDEVVRFVIKFNDHLINFYRQVAEETTSEEVRNLFMHLSEQEEADKRKTARGVAELE